MHITEALKLKRGDKVKAPSDRGSSGFTSEITFVGPATPEKNINGTEYIWVTLKQGGVWPTNRLSKG